MLSYLNVAIVKIPFRSWESRFAISNIVQSCTGFLGVAGPRQRWYWGAIDATPRANDLW